MSLSTTNVRLLTESAPRDRQSWTIVLPRICLRLENEAQFFPGVIITPASWEEILVAPLIIHCNKLQIRINVSIWFVRTLRSKRIIQVCNLFISCFLFRIIRDIRSQSFCYYNINFEVSIKLKPDQMFVLDLKQNKCIIYKRIKLKRRLV